MKPTSVNLQVMVTPWMAEQVDSLVGTIYGQTRAEIVRYLLRVGVMHHQLQASEAEKARLAMEAQA
jgi:hypothetical protein